MQNPEVFCPWLKIVKSAEDKADTIVSTVGFCCESIASVIVCVCMCNTCIGLHIDLVIQQYIAYALFICC